MKRIKFLFVLAALIFSAAILKADEEPAEKIIILSQDQTITGYLKAPALVPFTATISADGSFLTTSFQYPMGYVCIEIENDAWSTALSYYELAEGVVTLPTYLNPGVYTIYFTFDDGVEYVGEFEIL